MTPHAAVYFPVPGSAKATYVLRAAPQVPEWRPHPVPVQCHPAIPGLLPEAVWEGSARGSPGGHGQLQRGGPPLPIRHPDFHQPRGGQGGRWEGTAQAPEAF
uniref:Uncharacterized protein n=1 Tax=Phocoena sinus TaxID=42100 RepID=A0A8C9BHY3_PHOSS